MRQFGPPAALLFSLWTLGATSPASAEPNAAAATAAPEVVAERGIPSSEASEAARLRLLRDANGKRSLVRVQADGSVVELSCGTLEGAWGLWVEDVDGDQKPDAVIALRKKARFDPVLENRLHVYALVDDRCVPLWRGTRLAGRFDKVNPSGGTLLALERIGRGRRRVARYRWTGFGYALRGTLWVGTGEPPKRLLRKLEN